MISFYCIYWGFPFFEIRLCVSDLDIWRTILNSRFTRHLVAFLVFFNRRLIVSELSVVFALFLSNIKQSCVNVVLSLLCSRISFKHICYDKPLFLSRSFSQNYFPRISINVSTKITFIKRNYFTMSLLFLYWTGWNWVDKNWTQFKLALSSTSSQFVKQRI